MHTRRELTAMLAAAHLDAQGWAPVFDLDPLLPLRRPPACAQRASRVPGEWYPGNAVPAGNPCLVVCP